MSLKQAVPVMPSGGDLFARICFYAPGEKLPVEKMQPSAAFTGMMSGPASIEFRLSYEGDYLIFGIKSNAAENVFEAEQITIGFNLIDGGRQFFSFVPMG